MINVWIHAKDGMPATENGYAAMHGFQQMGCHIHFFSPGRIGEIPEWYSQLTRDDLVVGYIGDVVSALDYLGVPRPAAIDYPESIRYYLGRRVWTDRINNIADNPERWPLFIKSVAQKGFTGKVVRSPKDFIGIGAQGQPQEIFCSDIVDFQSEWRGYLRYGKLIDLKSYSGKIGVFPNMTVVNAAIADWEDKVAGCSIDFGVTKEGRTLVVECNDGFALGNYGVKSLSYAKMLSARWFQMVGGVDPFMTLVA